MGLKPDHWIRQQAHDHNMIDPFVDKQTRAGVISYGLSSYGYDMRVADEYKIFTNVHSAIVDPKDFVPESFVDFQGDVCIIPPNSFVLARSVEHFEIPRNTLAITMGKSTYARCFRGDTRVALADGSTPTLEEMAKRAESGEKFWGYSVGRFGRIIMTLLEAPRYIGRDALLEITLDNNEKIRCTPDHQFVTRDGRMVQAHDLRPQDALMPFDMSLWRSYPMVYQPLNGTLYPAHRLADEWNLRHQIYDDMADSHRHHIDHNHQNNMPWNIERMDATEHIQYSKMQSERILNNWHDDAYSEQREAHIEKYREAWTEERKRRASTRMGKFYADPANRQQASEHSKKMWGNASKERREQQRQIASSINIREEITAEKVEAALNEAGSTRGAARLLKCDRSVFRRFQDVVAKFRSSPHYRNHQVQSIRSLPGQHDVYCLTVPEAGNFALASGVFVKNCGLIVNVTPLEPGWNGYVTIEISNTTPLPAKVYSNEGIAQVLFFEGDDKPDISYADKKGKYMGQRGVTPPRMD